MSRKPVTPQVAVMRLKIIAYCIVGMILFILASRCSSRNKKPESALRTDIDIVMDRQLDSLIRIEFPKNSELIFVGEREYMEISNVEKDNLEFKKNLLEFRMASESYDQNELDKLEKEIKKLQEKYDSKQRKYAYYRRVKIDMKNDTIVSCIQRTDEDLENSFLFMRSKKYPKKQE